MIVDAVQGLTTWRPRLPQSLVSPPYENLGRPKSIPRDHSGTTFITARFRTGSTLLWNLFRHADDCVAYYEPFNERRWFDPASRAGRIDATHRGVQDYRREYEGLEELGSFYRDAWVEQALYMDEGAWDPDMKVYLDRLVAHAAPRRAVLQCNRIDFRLPWIRRHFRGATILHLYRHPRDQWCSSLLTPESVPRHVTIAGFEPFDHFYLRHWARDLARHFPFLGDPDLPAYSAFYLIWRLSHAFGIHYADYSLSFEQLTGTPGRAIADLMAAAGMSPAIEPLAALVTEQAHGRWDRYAPEGWYRDQEAWCESVLEQFADGQTATG